MKLNLEIEFKTLLNEQEYNALRSALPFSIPKKQTNVYYDTPDESLFKQGIMCRTRETDSIEFTLKVPQSNGVLEHEIDLSDRIKLCNETISNLLELYCVDCNLLRPVASSITIRQEYQDEFGTWCLDFTQFDHGSDYEVEYELFESSNYAEEHYINTLSMLGITATHKKPRPKYIRARFPSLKID